MRDFKNYQRLGFDCPGSRAACVALTHPSVPGFELRVWTYVLPDDVPGEFIHAVETVKEYYKERR